MDYAPAITSSFFNTGLFEGSKWYLQLKTIFKDPTKGTTQKAQLVVESLSLQVTLDPIWLKTFHSSKKHFFRFLNNV